MSTVPELEPVESPLERAKPAFLRRVKIRGYKSIAFCDVTLEPLTLLVGRNASGKSNFLDALAFLADLADMRISEAVSERKGWRSIHCRNSSTPYIELTVETTLAGYTPRWNAEYSVTLGEGPHNQIQLHRESLILNEHKGDRRVGYQFSGDRVEWVGSQHFLTDVEVAEKTTQLKPFSFPPYPWDGKFREPDYFRAPESDRLLLSAIGSQPFAELGEEFRASCVYNFSPPAIRELQPTTVSPVLARDGKNLARAIEGIRELEPQTIDRIGQFLSAIVEGVEGFRAVQYEDLELETVQFRLSRRSGAQPQLFNARNMSDGTLRVLAALVAAYQIYLPTNASGFIGIEEPETSLHPAAMRALVDALDEATLRKQILLTTHSAEMLDNPAIRPENVRVVQMIDGQTEIAPVDEASIEIVRRKLNTLGGLERDNLLEPDFDDLERQRCLSRNLGPSIQ